MKHLFFLLYISFSSVLIGEDHNAQLLLEFEGKSKASDQNLATLVEQASSSNTLHLIIGSAVAHKRKNYEDSAFLFYVAKFRGTYDKVLYPPKGKGGDSPFVAYSALTYQLGSVINPDIMKRPESFSKVTKKLKELNLSSEEGYDPGYEYGEKGSVEDAKAKLVKSVEKFNSSMGSMSILLSDETYFSAFTTMQDYNMKTGDERPSKEAYDKAVESIIKIEAEKELSVMKPMLESRR